MPTLSLGPIGSRIPALTGSNPALQRLRPTIPVIPTQPSADDAQCASDFELFLSVNGADYATRSLAMAAFLASSPNCAAWVNAQSASSPPPATMTDTQCANTWDGWIAVHGAAYSDRAAALTAFAAAYPACNAWVNAQLAAISTTNVAPEVTAPQASATGKTSMRTIALAGAGIAVLTAVTLYAVKG